MHQSFKYRIGHYISLTTFFLFISVFSFSQLIVQSSRAGIVAVGYVNLKMEADREALLPKPPGLSMGKVPNLEDQEYEEPTSAAPIQPFRPGDPNRITVVSPSPILNFEGAPDEAMGGGTVGSYTIPPDTYGAVGLDKVFTTLNNNYRILRKTSGTQLSLVSAQTFWNSLGTAASGVFDPRIVYDPYRNRWIIVAVSNGSSANSRVLIGISQTHDPEGNYTLYALDPDTGSSLWMDFPMLGFNKNWIVISGNMFTIPGASQEGRVFAIDYPSLLAGTMSGTLFSGITGVNGGFCMHPASTYSSTENTEYLVSHLSSAGATYILSTITGTPGTPVMTIGAVKVRPGGGWAVSGGNILPQQCLSSCPGSLVFADPGDQYVRGNVVFRNGAVWYSQTIQSSGAPVHSMVQWTKLDAVTGNTLDGGRIEDVTATSSNGGRWYGHPSVGVNKDNDLAVSLAKGESDGFLGAAYAFRYAADAAGTIQDPVLFKDGEDYYSKDFGSGRNRWGDYSHTMVDPLDDISFWTIQEYAKLRAAPTIGGSTSKWGTWWAKLAPNTVLSAVASGNWNAGGSGSTTAVPSSTSNVNIMSGQNITLDVDPLATTITVNEGGTLTINANRTLSCKLIVYGTLNISGAKVSIGNNDVFLSQSAVLSGASSSSYFVTNGTGKLIKMIAGGTSFEFPAGPSISSYNGLQLAPAAGNPVEVFSVNVVAGLNPATTNAASCLQRTWNINEMTSGGNNVTLTFKWAAADQGAGFNNTTGPYAFRHNGTAYVMNTSMTVPALSAGIYSSTTNTAITNFSPWIISSAASLPVVMEYFTGKKNTDGSNQLEWKADCNDGALLTLERSGDGKQFQRIYQLAANHIRCAQLFDYHDIAPLPGRNFYRVRSIDENGKQGYSPTLLLLNSKGAFEITSISPNPAKEKLTVSLSLSERQSMNLVVTDSKGTKLKEMSIEGRSGINQFTLDLGGWSAGAYFIKITAASGMLQTGRFLVQ